MGSRVVTTVLLLALGGGTLLLAPRLASLRLPGIHTGYEPAQPIAYSHRLHAGELAIPCLYCHFGAERSRHAGIPPAAVCMNCHAVVTAPLGAIRAEDAAAREQGRAPRRVVSAELKKLFDALALGEDLKPLAGRQPRRVEWVRVHSLPDFVVFDHRAHVGAGVACQTCHGPVETMERVRQVADLTMGWCVNCHRTAARDGIDGVAVRPSVDCVACHY